ncbi:SH3 domain-containing protein [Lacinutrix sp. 5H-3-7-4]|uniref:SH3 domain-containing protein n=1 Tax=Lacinutrix sp. (strain 5H-3-7-4) TaxID=983544 RepID=UPI00020A3516|nr:tetratricopeptide repeat protein [Lacinutrix sp. 5H-3-7-4]AEH00743.1 Tetratricopeptide TPR_2 repeat-containing protein [Lacinutrix sp. 5H-3-7-4]
MKYLLYIFLFFLGSVSAQNEKYFEQGNTLYNQGKYAEALSRYQAILKTNEHSAELYFNIANAHYKLNHIAPSVYYYEKALALKPNDKDIKNNLSFANNMRVDAIHNLPEVGLSKFVKNFANIMSFDAWAKVSIGLVVLFVLLYLAYYFTYTTGKKRLLFISSTLSIFLAFIALAFTFYNYNLTRQNNPAIVFAQEAQVKSEPNLRSDEAFVLHEGTKVQVLDTVNNWKKIKLSDGKTGWIPNSDIKLLDIFY